MSTFIEELDNMFAIAKTSEDSHAFDANYGIFIPIRVHIYGTINTNFIICKREFTKYLYIKGGCRVYFTDVDILTMLLSVKEQNTIRRFIDELKNLYKSNGVGQKYEIEFAGQSIAQRLNCCMVRMQVMAEFSRYSELNITKHVKRWTRHLRM